MTGRGSGSEAGLRVALLTPCFWPEVRRGSERFARELADGLLRCGHRPRLITSHPGRPRSSVEQGLPIMRHWRPPDGRLRRRLIQPHLTHLPFSYLSLRLGQDDVVHALYPTDGLVAGRWSCETGRPAVLSLMGLAERGALVGVRGRVQTLRRAAAGAAAVVSLSQAAAGSLRRVLGIDSRVIHPGVNLERFTPGPGRSPVPTILCASAIDEPRKRVGELIDAFAALRRRRPDVRLLLSDSVAGAGARASAAGDVDSVDGVELVDLDDPARLRDAYREAWVTALPSVAEAFGLVLVESLACGTPVVARSDGAAPEIIDGPEVGRLFDTDHQADQLCRALEQALELGSDPANAGACRERAGAFSIDACVDSYVRLYREVGAGADTAEVSRTGA